MAVATRSIPRLSETDIERFWTYVDKSDGLGPRGDCWIWKGSINNKGYGIVTNGPASRRLAHRTSFVIAFGNPPADRPFICHACDCPRCVRPDHLWPGTHSENLNDASNKGRMHKGDMHGLRKHPERRARGETHGIAKLCDNAISEIINAFNLGEPAIGIAKRFDVSRDTILEILRGKTWTHVADRPAMERKITRANRGSRNGRATVTEKTVQEIKRALVNNRVVDVVRAFGVSARVVQRIKSGESWKHITP